MKFKIAKEETTERTDDELRELAEWANNLTLEEWFAIKEHCELAVLAAMEEAGCVYVH